MKLKHITYAILAIFSSLFIYSCNDSSSTDVTYSYSNNNLIYSFSLAGKALNGKDTIAYPVLAATKFAIDHRNNIIYNPDSLPYGIRLTKFLPAVSFESGSTCKVEVVGPDSTWVWTSKDSVNFFNPIELIVTSPSQEYIKRYAIKLNVHQIDPDTIAWAQILPSLNKPSGSAIKAVISEDDLFIYVKTASTITVYASNKNTISWTSSTAIGLTAATTKLSSLTVFNDALYVVDDLGQVYTSPANDGVNWSSTANNKPVYNILGILPEALAANDSLLVVIDNGTDYSFAKSSDMSMINKVSSIKGFPSNIAPTDFPALDFSSTSYARSNANQNFLIVSGGTTFEGKQSMITWLIGCGRNNILEVNSTHDTKTPLFDEADDFKTVSYGDLVYGFTNDSVYQSKWGYDWIKAPTKQAFDPKMKTTKNQSVFVDKNNFIWVVGDMGGSKYDVWKGQLNKLRK